MDGKQLREALSQDPEEGDWFWHPDHPDYGADQVYDVISSTEAEGPFLCSRSVVLSDVWVVPTTDQDGSLNFKTFHTEEDARAFFAALPKSEE